ncbi:hypothetical protein BY458DRAFT_559496 [Sporodiniella umbellata]|nr:hypothetical protein BY458DRAFT_559496 [Sporodiniella umbellata]
MRSFEMLIENTWDPTSKKTTSFYLFERLHDLNKLSDFSFSAGVKHGLDERMYSAIYKDQELPSNIAKLSDNQKWDNEPLFEGHTSDKSHKWICTSPIRENCQLQKDSKTILQHSEKLYQRFNKCVAVQMTQSEGRNLMIYLEKRRLALMALYLFTDPRGARLFNLLPILGLQQRYALTDLPANKRWSLFGRKSNDFYKKILMARKLSGKRFASAISTAALTPGIVFEIVLNTAVMWGFDPGIRDAFITSTGKCCQFCRLKSAIVKESNMTKPMPMDLQYAFNKDLQTRSAQ